MPIVRLLFFAFLLVPIAEIYVLIQVGTVIGAFSTIVLIVFTALLGSLLIRMQGLATLERVRTAMARGEVPAVEMMEGVCLLVAGALLLTPGFVTDSIGFVLLVPMLRRAMIFALIERGVLRPASNHSGPTGTGPAVHGIPPRAQPGSRSDQRQIIDGEFERKDP